MKRIFTLVFILLLLAAVFAGCTEFRDEQRSPGVDYPPGGQENLNNYNNGLSLADDIPPVLPDALE